MPQCKKFEVQFLFLPHQFSRILGQLRSPTESELITAHVGRPCVDMPRVQFLVTAMAQIKVPRKSYAKTLS